MGDEDERGVYDILSRIWPALFGGGSVIVLLVILVLLVGVWPPMLSVTSGSMEPSISSGDLVVVKEPGQFEEAPAVDTFQGGSSQSFNREGDVIAYTTDESGSTDNLILHRAMFSVEEGENWYTKANPKYIPFQYSSCESLPNCPAPHDGYITKGDNNQFYDQATDMSTVVQSDYIHSEAVFVVPYVGYLQFVFSLLLAGTGVIIVYISLRKTFSGDDSEEKEEM